MRAPPGKKDFVHEGAASESADATKLKMYLAGADKILGDKSFFVYDRATYADVAMFHVLSTLEEIAGSPYLTDAGFARLAAFVRRFRYCREGWISSHINLGKEVAG